MLSAALRSRLCEHNPRGVSRYYEPISDTLDGHDIPTWFEISAGLEGPYKPTQQDPSEVLWRTLIADTYDKEERVSQPFEDTLQDVIC